MSRVGTYQRFAGCASCEVVAFKARLTVHPKYVLAGEPWLDPASAPTSLRSPGVTGWPGPARDPWGRPGRSRWRLVSVGRTDLFESVDTDGRTKDRRWDFASIHGDWYSIRHAAEVTSRVDGAPAVLHADGGAALRAVESDPGEAISSLW